MTTEYQVSAAQMEQIGKLADTCENYVGASRLPVSPAMHVEQLRQGLQEIARQLRLFYVEVTDDDPWVSE